MRKSIFAIISLCFAVPALAVKISDLNELTSPAADDLLTIVDTSASETKKITYGNAIRTVYVDDYGAAGDGVTNDNDEIDAAITACGTNCTLVFSPGKTYLIDRTIVPLQAQTWWGYGSTIKRANRVATTFTGSEPNGQTALSVADCSGFRVGSHVVGWEAGDETASMTVPVTVVSCVGGTTLNVTPGIFYAAGFNSADNIETGMEQITSAASDVKILGFTIDGNGSSYSAGLHAWEVHTEITLSGARSMVRDVYIDDSQLEGIIASGDGTMIVNNWIVGSGGNALHLSASNGLLVDGNYIFDSQVYNSDRNNHQDGAISISAAVVDATISNNYYDGNSNGLMFLGGVAADTQNLKILGNAVRDTSNSCMEAQGSFGSVTSGHIVSGNYFDNCLLFTFNDTGGFERVQNISISNNVIIDSRISIDNVVGFGITGNVFDLSGVTGTQFQILDSRNGYITDNSILSGDGILVALNTSGDNITVADNNIVGHASAVNAIQVNAGFTNVRIADNLMLSGTHATNSPTAIKISSPGTVVEGNQIDWSGITGGSNIVTWVDAVADVVFRDNTVVGGSGERAFVGTAGADNLKLTNNYFTPLIDPRGNENHIVGNYIEAGDMFITGIDNSVMSNTLNGGSISLLATADTNFVNGNRCEGTGENITIAVGATGNVVTNNATTAAISDSGSSTVTTSQNHTL